MYIQIHGDLEDAQEKNLYASTDEGVNIQLSINEEGDQPMNRCSNCGLEPIEDDPEPAECPNSGTWADCPSCNATGVCDDCGPHMGCCGPSLDCLNCGGNGVCADCEEGQQEIHSWELIPLHWCKSASIEADSRNDRVRVFIATDDPRGGFCMEVTRGSDGVLRLSVPHENMSFPHAPLERLSGGWFKIGH